MSLHVVLPAPVAGKTSALFLQPDDLLGHVLLDLCQVVVIHGQTGGEQECQEDSKLNQAWVCPLQREQHESGEEGQPVAGGRKAQGQ